MEKVIMLTLMLVGLVMTKPVLATSEAEQVVSSVMKVNKNIDESDFADEEDNEDSDDSEEEDEQND